MTTDSILAKFK